MGLFETISSAFSQDAAKFVTSERIKLTEERLTVYREIVFDLEKELETLKKQLHDTNNTCKNPSCTIVDDMYNDGSLGV